MEETIVNVTKGDIDTGERRSASHCSLALAMNRHFGTVMVFGNTVSAIYNGAERWQYLPEDARRFVFRFDEFGKRFVSPFSFVMEPASKWRTEHWNR